MDNSQLIQLLEEERVKLEQELTGLRQDIVKLKRKKADSFSRLCHVRGLLGLPESPAELPDDGAMPEGRSFHPDSNRNICDLAAEILREQDKKPMYYKDLAVEVMRRGGIIGGATPEATLVSRMTRDGRFIRPYQKGRYALREDYPESPNVGARQNPRIRS